jgi:hypothetical protein
MLSKTAKLHWGLGHKSLKTVHEGSLVPLMTYGAPVWEEATTKQCYLCKIQSAQRLINIKKSEGVQNHLLRGNLCDGRGPTNRNSDRREGATVLEKARTGE